MTRTVKNNDRNHAGLADGTAVPEDRLPRYFAKSGHVDADPKSIKKQGAGRGNWGTMNDDVDDSGFRFANQRRRSNSSTQALDIKTKFETNETEPVFEEELHGPSSEDIEAASTLSKEDTNSSNYSASVDLNEDNKRM